MSESQKDIARTIEEQILDRGRLDLIPEIFHPDAVVHGPIYTIFLKPCHNHDEIREHVVGNRTGFPDLHHAVHGQLEDGEHVVTYFTVSGTNDGEFAGSPPSGNVMKGPGISIERFVDGKIADSWQTCDRTLNFMQLGFLEPGLLPESSIANPAAMPVGTIGGVADPGTVATNKGIIERLYLSFNGGEPGVIDELVAPDAVMDMPGIQGASRDDLRAFVDAARTGLDVDFSVELLVAEGDLVAALVRLTGTHRGDYYGRPPTGNAIDVEVHQTWRVQNGKVTAMYGLPDWFSLAAQLGPIPAAGAAAASSNGEPVVEHPNAAVLRGAYAALAKGDIMSAYAVFAPDLVWRVPEGHRLAGTYEGRDTVFGMLGQLVTMTGGSLQMHVDEVLANEARGVGLITSTATRNGKDFVAKEVHIFELERGKVKVFWTLPQVPFPAEYWAGAPIGDALPVPAG
jgi:predicted ester cyclase